MAQGVPADGGVEEPGEAIIITGSRLRVSGMETAVPVTAVQADELKAMAPTTMVEGLSQLPQFYGNTTQQANAFFGSGSAGGLNLRGPGHQSHAGPAQWPTDDLRDGLCGVDISNFPEALISNVETVTGGASAAYGTDAVAGVTNFILNTPISRG